MEGKSSFILYCDLAQMVHKMPDEDAGKLFKLIFEYTNDEDPDESKYGILVEVAFAQVKQILKRDLVKWNETKEGKSIGGRMGNLKRYQNDLYLQVVSKKITLEKAEEIAKSRTTSHTDSMPSHSVASVAVNVNDNVNGKDSTEGKTDFPSLEDVIKFCDENGYASDHAKDIFEYYDSQQWKDKNDQDISSKWKYQVRKIWFKDEGRKPLTNEERMQAFNNPPISKEFWDRLTRSEQHSYQVMHGGSGFPLKKT